MRPTEADVVVVAAGESRRMGGGSSKLLLPLAGKPLLAWTLAPFQASPKVRRVVLVIRDSDREATSALVRREGLTKAQGHYAAGGACRADSVASGLDFLHRQGPAEWVLVHDGARPFVRPRMIEESLQAAEATGSAIVAIPVQDTIKEADAQRFAMRTLDRRRLWQVQTPQAFRFTLLWEAYRKLPPGERSRWTDDAMVLEAQGTPAAIVPGNVTNLKVTTRDDLLWAEFLLSRHPELRPEG